jgi:hypothetical protein
MGCRSGQPVHIRGLRERQGRALSLACMAQAHMRLAHMALAHMALDAGAVPG